MRFRFSVERMMAAVSPEPNTGCWLYLKALNSTGYGPHRRFYERFKGPIPVGATLDHKCRVRSCVNPDHLRPLSLRANILLSDSVSARHARRKSCMRGHPREADGRRCRKCQAMHQANFRAATPERRQERAEYARRWRRGEVG